MITYEDVEETTAKTDKCLHCKKQITREDRCYKLAVCVGGLFRENFRKAKPEILEKYIFFCEECWKAVAGEEYCFEE